MFLIALMATTLYAQRAGHRFATNLFNVIQMRMLPDQDAKTYLAHNGLQIGPTLTSAIGKPIWEVTNRDSHE